MQFFLLPMREIALAVSMSAAGLAAQEKPASPYHSSAEFEAYAGKLREAALTAIEPRVSLPTSPRDERGVFKWKTGIVTTVFHVGGSNGERSSAWDPRWRESFGGDDPMDSAARLSQPEYRPKKFIPQLNPFYCALPYNDVAGKETKPEARTAIPWFRTDFVAEGQSVCRDRWIAIRNARNGRIAYAQWADAGPYHTDHWQYVFGNERPMPNASGGAGLSVSPAVRDFLGTETQDVNDWRFVEVRGVPPGPWRRYGANNPFVNGARAAATTPAPKIPIANPEIVPTVRPR